MKHLEFTSAGAVNPAVLDAEIRAALGADKIAGLSTDGAGGIIVHVLDEALSEADVRAAIAGVLKVHDATVKSDIEQQLEATRQALVAFIDAPDISKERAMTTAELTARLVEHEKMLKLLLGAREEKG